MRRLSKAMSFSPPPSLRARLPRPAASVLRFAALSARMPLRQRGDAIRLLMGSQFWYFRQLLESLKPVLKFSNAGWKHFYETLTS